MGVDAEDKSRVERGPKRTLRDYRLGVKVTEEGRKRSPPKVLVTNRIPEGFPFRTHTVIDPLDFLEGQNMQEKLETLKLIAAKTIVPVIAAKKTKGNSTSKTTSEHTSSADGRAKAGTVQTQPNKKSDHLDWRGQERGARPIAYVVYQRHRKTLGGTEKIEARGTSWQDTSVAGVAL